MTGLVDTLISATIGFLAGLAGSAANERLKSGVSALEVELSRLDSLHDKLGDTLATPLAIDRSSATREINTVRRRLGVNLRGLVPDSASYQLILGMLTRLDLVIGRAEDSEMLTPQLAAELDEIVRGVRANVKVRSLAARAWWLLRGR